MGIAIDAMSETLYVLEHHRIRSVPLFLSFGRTSTEVRTVAAVGIRGFADGPATLAQFNDPQDIAVTQTGDLFVADTGNFRIRRVTPSGMVTTVAGDGVPAVPTDEAQFADARPALSARFERPSGLAVDSTGMVGLPMDIMCECFIYSLQHSLHRLFRYNAAPTADQV